MRRRKKHAKKVHQKSRGKEEEEGRASVKVKSPGGEVMRVKCLLNEFPKAKRAPGKENVDSQVNLADVPA